MVHPGEGMNAHQTPPETWAAMSASFMRLTDQPEERGLGDAVDADTTNGLGVHDDPESKVSAEDTKLRRSGTLKRSRSLVNVEGSRDAEALRKIWRTETLLVSDAVSLCARHTPPP
jgi:hypothetical protein|eukprot:1720459-Prymnesium_polylepis.1